MKSLSTRWITLVVMLLACSVAIQAAPEKKRKNAELVKTSAKFFSSDEARRIGDQILMWQRVTGGWPKNVDMCSPMTPEQVDAVLAVKDRRDDSTIDNNATTIQMTYLARLYRATGDVRYRDAFRRGVDFLLAGQYPSGGWPQFWPDNRDYQIHITYNDGAMVNTMRVIRDMMYGHEPYGDDIDLMDPAMRPRLLESFYKGVECILATQIRDSLGRPTVWCQQHYRDTYEPAPARAYELPSFCSNESAGIIALLMEVPDPDSRIKSAVHGAMRWLDDHKITGFRYDRWNSRGEIMATLVPDDNAEPIWARFYDLKYGEPYVCDRDGLPRRHLEQIGYERRNGYGWYSRNAAELYEPYREWCAKWDPSHMENISLTTPGGNVTGIMDLDRKETVDVGGFDAVVEPGGSIQAAVDRAPLNGKTPFKILVRKGVYNEKVVIDRPNVVLVGEDRDATRIEFAELRGKERITEHNGQPVKNGVIVLQEGADDCLISGLTVYNNYGTTVEDTRSHQMAIYGKATRTIIVNCNIKSDGNDALSLWAQEDGMYYHADLNIECRGVDFMCPRGKCFATRCRFLGNGPTLIWHDGRGDKTHKLVITDSDFDSRQPAPLGRYHHDSQFFLMNCYLSKNVLDRDISYAYTDKVIDPCPWGKRVYYLNCHREGGHSGWLADNFQDSEDHPLYHEVTPRWTFADRWNPEARIRTLWPSIRY